MDTHVGNRLRQRRALLGMSQTDLGNAVGLTFQQVQKYERGFNRVSSSRLFEFAKVLDVPVEHFFDGMDEAAVTTKRKPGRPRSTEKSTDSDLNTKRETLELVRAYYKIRSKSLREKTRELIMALARD
ncbi:helix-turn-helix transcriptional regulator [Reyranella aquatilis]|uniref:Helix-turn-helix transcriptional regulator n=1 Tax=Reyranella aquatilis TaxID=2035356 RepID=A0ABS8KQ11_9HYPH|nr:helix-turn-helix transcriptional regulator [Reyranella aquatilis]MCC8427857.1 helix-turn-helix transcriptional regulator [Reyranella aquatilis]